MIKEDNFSEKECAPEVKVKTRIFRAVPVKNTIEESMFMITTARRSSIEVSHNCFACGTQINKQERETCAGCTHDFCSRCMQEHSCEEEYDDD